MLAKSTSAKMQPMDQISIAGLYFAKKLPHSSGARYLHQRAGELRTASTIQH